MTQPPWAELSADPLTGTKLMYLYVFNFMVGASVCECMHVNMCLYVYACGNWWTISAVIFGNIISEIVSHWLGAYQLELGWPARQSSESACLCLPGAGMIGPWVNGLGIFTWALRDRTQVLILVACTLPAEPSPSP